MSREQLWHKSGYHAIIVLVLAVCFTLALPFGVSAQKSSKDEVHTSRYYVSRADEYEKVGAWELAKREIDEGLEQYPDDPDLRYLNGRYYYYSQKDLHQARYNLLKALQENDQHYLARRLMVDVEEDDKHYSSAICYINELLEFEPYDRDLWRRKINLYNQIGHTVEADQALERLARIYPTDSLIRDDINARNRENWGNVMQTSSVEESISTLENYIEHDPTNLDYYFALIRLYRSLGEYDRAIGTVNRALYYSPGNAELIDLGVAVYSGNGEFVQALNFLTENHVGGALYNRVLQQVANDDRIRDPYDANGRLYARTGNRDALIYLLNTSLTRGYYNDAKFYLAEAMKIFGVNSNLLLKEYELEKRFGTEQAQLRVLKQLYDLNPNDHDYGEEYADLIIELGSNAMETRQWGEALDYYRHALSIMTPENPNWVPTVSREITVLGHLGRMNEALKVYEDATRQRPRERARFASSYEDIAASNLRGLMEEEQYEEAFEEAQRLLRVLPTSEVALRACINLSQTMGKEDLFRHYAQLGYDLYPNTPYFIVKQATSLHQQGQTMDALILLSPRPDGDYYLNSQLSNAYQGIAGEWGLQLLKDKMPDVAMRVADYGLYQNPDNKELLYIKGLAYEQLKEFGKAYDYQVANYNPSNAEQEEWYQHMRYLRYRGYGNRIDATYTYASYDSRSSELASVAHMYSIASVTYSRVTDRNNYTFQLSYKGMDGYLEGNYWESGGMGIEFFARWDHNFNNRLTGWISGSVANQFFNTYGGNIGLSYDLKHGWTPSLNLGYRRTANTVFYFPGSESIAEEVKQYNLFIASPSIMKSWERINVSMTADLSYLRNTLYYNIGVKGKIFINEDNMSSVGILGSYGTFPELGFFDQALLGSLDKSNATVGVEGSYLLTKNLFVSLSGTWNTFYNPLIAPTGQVLRGYRNVYILTGALHVAF